MDTNRFRGVWAKVVYVRFDSPESAEVRLTIQANSRDDVRLTPTSIAFGQIAPGAEPKASVQLSIGEANLSIVDVKTDRAFIQRQAKPMCQEGGPHAFR